jgi:hypothetical protein
MPIPIQQASLAKANEALAHGETAKVNAPEIYRRRDFTELRPSKAILEIWGPSRRERELAHEETR